ncbi:hypothetical protein INS49_009497 [Diaporthe citri]|uniref:uncharacterized protein n=1 Tax=Diaporthe citri TaxID=83186 RepID=UPI001C8216C7|nr:uncharacterized protein INS49_009497 [Diaporthe citri]KAG6361272.1 hypothetical protein INS49_009497 [Diaporthe citri]
MSTSSASAAIILVLEALLVSIVLRCFYNLFLHPLRKFPGPLAHRASVVPTAIKVARGRWTTNLLRMTDKFGPVVRVSPNELIFTDPAAWKDVYGHQNGAVVKGEEFPKAAYFYRNRGVPPSIISETRENHALLRRQMSPGFSDRSLREQETIVKGYVDLLIKQLRDRCVPTQSGEDEGKAEGRPPHLPCKTAFDMRHWFNYVTYDIIGDLAFGESFSCLEQGRAVDRVSSIEKGLQAQAMTNALKQLGLEGLVKWLVKSRTKFRRENDALTMAVLKRRMALKHERPDLIGGLLKKQDDWEIPMRTLMINAMILIIAGSDTSATLLSGLIYLLLKNPGCLLKITHEVRSAFKSEDEISFSSVQSLPYMLACIKETFRRYPPVPGSMPRVVPKGGANVAGHFVPEGTIVSVAQLPILAYAEVKLILARVLYNFDMELVDPGEDWMDQKAFLMWTKPPLNIYLTPAR